MWWIDIINYKLYKTYPFLLKEEIVYLPYSKFQKSSKIPAEIKKNLNQMKKWIDLCMLCYYKEMVV